MAELEELEQEELDQKLLDVGSMIDNLPSVPSDPVPVAASKSRFQHMVIDFH